VDGVATLSVMVAGGAGVVNQTVLPEIVLAGEPASFQFWVEEMSQLPEVPRSSLWNRGAGDGHGETQGAGTER